MWLCPRLPTAVGSRVGSGAEDPPRRYGVTIRALYKPRQWGRNQAKPPATLTGARPVVGSQPCLTIQRPVDHNPASHLEQTHARVGIAPSLPAEGQCRFQKRSRLVPYPTTHGG